jgi:hypothetical protein
MLADLGPLVASWRPDLLIHDSTEMAGAIAAEVAGIAHAEHSFALLRPAAARRLATETLAPVSAAAGVTNPGVGGIDGELYLDVCPPSIQFPEIAEVPAVMPLRPDQLDVPPDGRFGAWIGNRPARPTIYLTMGTVFNDPAVFRTVLDGLAREPLDVIVTVGVDADPAVLGPQPDNVYVDRFIPQAQVLAHSRVMVSHAGSGAMLGAANAAVPILALPQGADQFQRRPDRRHRARPQGGPTTQRGSRARRGPSPDPGRPVRRSCDRHPVRDRRHASPASVVEQWSPQRATLSPARAV